MSDSIHDPVQTTSGTSNSGLIQQYLALGTSFIILMFCLVSKFVYSDRIACSINYLNALENQDNENAQYASATLYQVLLRAAQSAINK